METNRKVRFKQYFQQYYPVLCRIAHGYVADADDCEDIVQELFVSVWNRGKDEMPEEQLAAYLTSAVRNNCISFLRDRQRMETVSIDDRLAMPVDSSAEETAAADYGSMLEKVLAAMPPKCRDVFMMSKMQKMKYKEIAAALDISEKTVENHIGKAFKMIRLYAATHPMETLLIILSHLMTISL